MNYYTKKYIEIKEFILDFILCCFDCISKQKTRVYYYNLDDFNMENNFYKVNVTTSENNYYQEPVITQEPIITQEEPTIIHTEEEPTIIIQDIIETIVTTTENNNTDPN
jgi:hypothetical protein